MPTQLQIYYKSRQQTSIQNNHFIDIVNDKCNPLTNNDLEQLVIRFPERWAKFSGYIGTLKN